MDSFGFIHGELDIKILILFVLRRLKAPVSGGILEQLCMIDGGMNYFDYSDCLASLVETGHVKEDTPAQYVITERGFLNGEVVEMSLPYSVRAKAEQLLAPVAAEQSRANMINASHMSEKGGIKVSLSMSDGLGLIIGLDLLVPDESQAAKMEENFRVNAEAIYGRVAEILLEDF